MTRKHFNPMEGHLEKRPSTADAKIVDISFMEIIHETDKAWLICFVDAKGGEHEHWVPKSVGEMYEDDKMIVLPQWFIDKNGMDV